MLKFSANISTMFKYLSMCERFNEASAFNFQAVEVQFLYDDPLSLLLEGRKAAPVEFVLMNSPYKPGDLFSQHDDTSDDKELIASMFYATCTKSLAALVNRSDVVAQIIDPFGLACLPGCGIEFGNTIMRSMRVCDLMKCKKMHILAGKTPPNLSFSEVEATYLHSMKWAVEQLEEYNIMTVIEPLCEETLPGYFLNSFEQAVDYITRIKSENFKLLLDVYHLYKIEGDVEAGLRKYLPYAGHIQISQSPGRIDPFQNGDINYATVLDIIKESGYDGYIGLEYTPVDETAPDFTWIKNYTD